MRNTSGLFAIALLLTLVSTAKLSARVGNHIKSTSSQDSLNYLISQTRASIEKSDWESCSISLTDLNRYALSLESLSDSLSNCILQLNLCFQTKSHLLDAQSQFIRREESTLNPSYHRNLDVDSLMNSSRSLYSDLERLRIDFSSLKFKNKKLNEELDKQTKGVNLGLSLGFNFFLNNQLNYVVGLDSSIHQRGNSKGLSFILSGIISYRFDEHNTVIFNIPLGDFNGNSHAAIGLFNKRAAGGIGYGYQIGNVAFMGIINLSPYQKIEYDLFEGHKSSLPAFTSLPAEDYGTTIAYSPSFTIGVAYQLVKGFRPFKDIP